MKKILNNKEILLILLVLSFFLSILLLTPISGDDWGNYLVSIVGPDKWINHVIWAYNNFEGRILSRLVINVLTANKIVWDIFQAGLITILYIVTIKIINPKHKMMINVLYLLSFLLVSRDMFTQTYLWMAGSITYFIPLVLTVIYMFLLDIRLLKNKSNYLIVILSVIISSIVPLFVENMGVVIVFMNIVLFLLMLYKNKRIDYLLLICSILSLLSFVLMVTSPGSSNRMMGDHMAFDQLPIYMKMIHQLPEFIFYTFTNNDMLLFMFPISTMYLINKHIKNKLKIVLTVFSVLPFVILLTKVYNYNIIEYLSTTSPYLFFIYWVLYMLMVTYLLFKNSKKDYKVLFLFALAFVSNGAMLIAPVWGDRTALFTTFILLVVNLSIIDELLTKIHYKKQILLLSSSMLLIVATINLGYYINIHEQVKYRGVIIKQQLDIGADEILINEIPSDALWCINPTSTYHMETFKQYYHIPLTRTVTILKKEE